ncbi:MAG TPA: dihydroneopterin aldolase [Candidatus Dormibacteraeota bacterium]|nr:dihydroneopterin aldolase [Candidatus Dormibacteraeota bacterium]
MDAIALRGIRVRARHGADPGEREREQTFEIDVVAEIALGAAAASDDVGDTLHYGRLYRSIVEVVRARSHALLERVAADVLDAVFADARVARASVTIAKPELLDGATPSITLKRENPRYVGQ